VLHAIKGRLGVPFSLSFCGVHDVMHRHMLGVYSFFDAFRPVGWQMAVYGFFFISLPE